MNGAGRLIFTLWLGAAFGQALALFALFDNLETTRAEAVGRTLQAMVSRVAEAASASAKLGLPLAYQANLNQLIAQLSPSDQDDIDLYILDGDGNVVFSTNAEQAGARIPAAWLQPAGTAGDDWLATTPRETVAGERVTTDIATDAGSVIAAASHANLAIDVLASMRTAVVAALGFLVLAGIFAVLGTSLATRSLQARLLSIAERYRRAAAEVRAGKVPEEGPPSTACLDAARRIMAVLDAVEARGRDADHVSAPAPKAAKLDEVAR